MMFTYNWQQFLSGRELSVCENFDGLSEHVKGELVPGHGCR